MTFLNQFHKEAMERTMRKIEESKKSPMNLGCCPSQRSGRCRWRYVRGGCRNKRIMTGTQTTNE